MQTPTPGPTPAQLEQIARGLAENGRVLATLDDWRAIMFGVAIFLIIVLISLLFVIFMLLRSNRQERQEMTARLDRALLVSDKFGEAAATLAAELQVGQALNARVETALGACERWLEQTNARKGR